MNECKQASAGTASKTMYASNGVRYRIILHLSTLS